jgi:hypothetical protein
VRAEYDYQAQQEEEISFEEGDEMDLLERDDPDWYLVKHIHGQVGLAPSNYVQLSEQYEIQQEEEEEHEEQPQAMPVAPPVNLTTPTSIPSPVVQPVLSHFVKKRKKKKKKTLLIFFSLDGSHSRHDHGRRTILDGARIRPGEEEEEEGQRQLIYRQRHALLWKRNG